MFYYDSESLYTEYFNGESTKQGGSLALMRGIQQCFIDIQHRCVRATDELSRLVIETASHRPATLKYFRAQELALERQTRLWEFSKWLGRVTLVKEKSHTGCLLNERADELAELGRQAELRKILKFALAPKNTVLSGCGSDQ